MLPQHQAGLIRIIATTRATRLPDLPDIPSINETVPGVETVTWLGLFAPAGTPQPIIDKLNGAVKQAISDPDLVQKFKLQGMAARADTPAELATRVKTELDMWGRIIPSIGISPE